MRLYYFTAARYAIDDIENSHIKISQISCLNDPNEWLPNVKLVKRAQNMEIDIPVEYVRYRFERTIFTERGIVSMTRRWNNLPMWGLYAEHCRGTVLEIEVDESEVQSVRYCDERVELNKSSMSDFDRLDNNDFDKIVNVKASGWSFEDEMRMILPLHHELCECKDGMFFLPMQIGNSTMDGKARLRLVGVICGPLMAPQDIASLRHVLHDRHPASGVQIEHAVFKGNEFSLERIAR